MEAVSVNNKKFRNTYFVLYVIALLVAFAASIPVSDADWDVRLVTVMTAMAPWVIAGTIVQVGGAIINAIKGDGTA